MRALSIQQPFASAIIDGPKRVENRTWSVKVPDGGQWLAIHASKGLFKGFDEAWLRELWPTMPRVADLPRGALLGLAHLASIQPIAELSDPWAGGPQCWVFDRVIALPQPLACKGAQGLWRLPDDMQRIAVDLLKKVEA